MASPHPEFKYIEIDEDFVWPYRPNKGLVSKISKPEEWQQVTNEFKNFLDGRDILNLGPPDTLLMKMQGYYVITEDTTDEEKIKNRQDYPFEIMQDLFDENRNYLCEGIVGVRSVYESVEEFMHSFRKEKGIGYMTLVVDIWENESTTKLWTRKKVVKSKNGFHLWK